MNEADKNKEALQQALPGLAAPRLEEIRAKTRVHVHFVPGPTDVLRDRETQLFVLLDLLPRMFTNVTIAGADPAKVFESAPSHAAKLRKVDIIPDDAQQVIALTGVALTRQAGVIYVDNRGWQSITSTIAPATEPQEEANPMAATHAAAIAVGHLLNALMAQHNPHIHPLDGRVVFNVGTLRRDDMTHLPPVPARVWLRETALVGVGAVGQALVYCLSRLPALAGELWLIDPEAIDESNESRYLLAFRETRTKYKTNIAADLLRRAHGPLLTVNENIPKGFALQTALLPLPQLPRSANPAMSSAYNGIAADYEEFQRVVRAGRPFELVIAAVDTAATRRDIQASLPRLILNGWTSTRPNEMEYGVGVHRIDGPDQCLACVYHAVSDSEPDTVDFAARLTGWKRDDVRRHFSQNAALTPDELNRIAARLNIDPNPHLGKTLRQMIHVMCGEGIPALGGRLELAPLFHVPTIVGALLAAQTILHTMGEPRLRNHAVFDALRLPTPEDVFFQQKSPGCICTDADVKRVHSAEWPSAGAAPLEPEAEPVNAPL